MIDVSIFIYEERENKREKFIKQLSNYLVHFYEATRLNDVCCCLVIRSYINNKMKDVMSLDEKLTYRDSCVMNIAREVKFLSNVQAANIIEENMPLFYKIDRIY